MKESTIVENRKKTKDINPIVNLAWFKAALLGLVFIVGTLDSFLSLFLTIKDEFL